MLSLLSLLTTISPVWFILEVSAISAVGNIWIITFCSRFSENLPFRLLLFLYLFKKSSRLASIFSWVSCCLLIFLLIRSSFMERTCRIGPWTECISWSYFAQKLANNSESCSVRTMPVKFCLNSSL